MVRIKVCKLSDLITQIVIYIIIFVGVFFTYQITKRMIEPYTFEFIQFSLQKNLCLKSKNKIWEVLICENLLTPSYSLKNNLKKEWELAENISVKEKNNTVFEEKKNNDEKIKQELNKIEENITREKLELTPQSILMCEKISSSKYKIGSVTINDYTRKNLDFTELEKSMFVEVPENCNVLLYHTHTSESYSNVTNSLNEYHTDDKELNVVRVGKTLKTQLEQYGFLVKQDVMQHDYPSYNGAYKSSLKSVENILKNENYDIIIDIHRDALASNSQYRPTAEINGETVAKLMFVVGTNAAGMKHDNWIENLKFAIAFQQRANELFPGLFRDLHLSTSRYNQHTSNKTLILEVGATGNTLEESCLAMKYFAQVLNAMKM